MPVSQKLQSTVTRALQNKILSRGEGRKILDQVRSAEDVKHVVSAIQDAYNAPNGLEVTQFSRGPNLNWLLTQLNDVSDLPLDPGRAQPGEGGAMNWIAALKFAQNPDPIIPDPVVPDPVVPDPVVPGPVGPGPVAPDPVVPAGRMEALAKKSFGGQQISADNRGNVALGGQAIALNFAAVPNDQQLEALQALSRPGQLDLLSDAGVAALADNLLAQVDAALPVNNEAQGKYRQVVASLAALGTVSNVADKLSAGQIDTLLAQYKDAPNPLSKAIILRTLQEAPCSAAQTQKRDGLEAPETKDVVLANYDKLVSGQARTKAWNRVEGAAVGFALSAMTFAKNQSAIDNVFDGMDTYAELNVGRPTWDAQELGHMAGVLETYVDKYPQTAYVFGTFSKDAPKSVAKLSNERTAGILGPKLEGAQPTFDGIKLTAPQAKLMKSLLGGIKDEGAVRNMSRALSEAADLMNPQLGNRWGQPDKPNQALGSAAFAVFARAAAGFAERQEGTADGMINVAGLADAIKADVGSIKDDLVPVLTGLNANPAKMGAATLSADAATYVKSLLSNHLRSEMSVTNIAEAVEVISKAHGGQLQGEGLQQLTDLVNDYKGNWPDKQVFDFNKLGRMARFKVKGEAVPLSTVNGKQIGLAEFYTSVAKNVGQSFNAAKLEYPWMADRWGMRAKESVEVLDVIAQRTAEGAGPVAELQNRYPNSEVTVIATGADGAHEQFIFDVRGQGRFAQSSEGELQAYNGRAQPELFSAAIRSNGAFDIKIAPAGTQTTKEWPLQTPYSIGDSIDVTFLDPDAVKAWEEGEKFSTEHKIVHGTIKGFDKNGYSVSYKKPDGEVVVKKLSMKDIAKANNPHNFSLKGSEFSDVSINVDRDEDVKSFITDAQPLIDQFLPRDGSLLELNSSQLAKRQKNCVNAIMKHVAGLVKYPASKDAHPDEKSAKYHELIDGLGYNDTVPFGELLDIQKGVCRHQCIAEHLLMQVAGIDSRLASGAANDRDGGYRGLHIWTELSLADNARYLSDQTWNDALIPLWNGAYNVDKRRVEMFHRTDRYRNNIV